MSKSSLTLMARITPLTFFFVAQLCLVQASWSDPIERERERETECKETHVTSEIGWLELNAGIVAASGYYSPIAASILLAAASAGDLGGAACPEIRARNAAYRQGLLTLSAYNLLYLTSADLEPKQVAVHNFIGAHFIYAFMKFAEVRSRTKNGTSVDMSMFVVPGKDAGGLVLSIVF